MDHTSQIKTRSLRGGVRERVRDVSWTVRTSRHCALLTVRVKAFRRNPRNRCLSRRSASEIAECEGGLTHRAGGAVFTRGAEERPFAQRIRRAADHADRWLNRLAGGHVPLKE